MACVSLSVLCWALLRLCSCRNRAGVAAVLEVCSVVAMIPHAVIVQALEFRCLLQLLRSNA